MISAYIDSHGFTVSGHADYDESGKDIVCAGVSTLAQYVELLLNSYAEIHVEKKHGYVNLLIIEPNVNTELILGMMSNILRLIESDYSEYISVYEGEDGHDTV